MHFRSFCSLILILSLSGCSTPKTSPWTELRTPLQGNPEIIGTYSAGCLKGAISLYPDGNGYQMMRLSRRRFYGHPSLIAFIERLGRYANNLNRGSILVGDLSQPRGGPSFGGHTSHQIGLDVDIWFQRAEGSKLTLDERENGAAKSVLNAEANLDPQRWTHIEGRLLQAAAEESEVDRIFVDPLIKRDLCQKFKAASWLHKIRPWWKHHDHFHVRLKCPAQELKCQPQQPVPAGTGCDETLDWWFTDEAKALREKGSAQFVLPKLPLECKMVLETL